MKPLDLVEARTLVGPDTTQGDATSVYVIDEPRSSYLVSNLVGTTGRHAITITAPHVTLDLNGFEVLGEHQSDRMRRHGQPARRVLLSGPTTGRRQQHDPSGLGHRHRPHRPTAVGLRRRDALIRGHVDAQDASTIGILAGTHTDVTIVQRTYHNTIANISAGPSYDIDPPSKAWAARPTRS